MIVIILLCYKNDMGHNICDQPGTGFLFVIVITSITRAGVSHFKRTIINVNHSREAMYTFGGNGYFFHNREGVFTDFL